MNQFINTKISKYTVLKARAEPVMQKERLWKHSLAFKKIICFSWLCTLLWFSVCDFAKIKTLANKFISKVLDKSMEKKKE